MNLSGLLQFIADKHDVSRERCSATLSAALQRRFGPLGTEVELTLEDASLELMIFRTVRGDDEPAAPGTITLQEALALDLGEFEIGDELGVPPTRRMWARALEAASADPLEAALVEELAFFERWLPQFKLSPDSPAQAGRYLQLARPLTTWSELPAAVGASPRSRDSEEDEGIAWRYGSLWWMSERWQRAFQAKQERAEPVGVYEKWRRGFVPIARTGTGADLGSVLVYDARADSPTRGSVLDLCWHEGGVVASMAPGDLFAALRLLEEREIDPSGGSWADDKIFAFSMMIPKSSLELW